MFDSDPYDEWMETIVSHHRFLSYPRKKDIICAMSHGSRRSRLVTFI